jgi:hypothetical protein
MQPKELYKCSRALDNEPTFRNINYRPGPDAFDDLLDPGETSSEATIAAFQKANRMRSTVNEVAALDQSSLFHIVIQRVFQRAIFYPSRYGDGSFPVWYGCLDPLTTIHETAYQMINEEKDLAGHQSEVVRRRIICRVSCTAILIDLTRDRKFFPQLTDPSNYNFTQQIGKRIRDEQHPGLLCPSARQPDGKNLAIFNGTCLSNPELLEQLVYRLNLKSMTIDVYRDDQLTTTIDGNQLLVRGPS